MVFSSAFSLSISSPSSLANAARSLAASAALNASTAWPDSSNSGGSSAPASEAIIDRFVLGLLIGRVGAGDTSEAGSAASCALSAAGPETAKHAATPARSKLRHIIGSKLIISSILGSRSAPPPPPRPPPHHPATHHRPHATAVRPPPRHAARPPPRYPPPMVCRPRLELTLVALPRPGLPMAVGLFGRRSTRAPAFGLPDGRLAAFRLPEERWQLSLAGRAAWRFGRCLCRPGAVARFALWICPGSFGCRVPALSVGQVARPLPSDVLGPASEGVGPMALEAVLDLRPVDIGQLVPVEIELGAVDVLPVDILQVDPAVDVVQAIVATDVDIATPVATPDAIAPIDGAPQKAPVTAPAKKPAAG